MNTQMKKKAAKRKPKASKRPTPERAAHLIAMELFKQYDGKMCYRLAQITKEGRDLGGYGFDALRNRLTKILKGEE